MRVDGHGRAERRAFSLALAAASFASASSARPSASSARRSSDSRIARAASSFETVSAWTEARRCSVAAACFARPVARGHNGNS